MKLLYPVIDGHKECGDCHIVKPVSEYPVRNKPSKDGLFAPRTTCRTCNNTRAIKYNRLNGFKPSKRYPIINDHKKCTSCNEHKHVSEYDLKSNGKILAKCRPCYKLYVYEHNVKSERIEYAKNWHKQNKDSTKRKTYQALQRDNLTDYYVKSIMTRYIDLSFKDIPQELVDIKRKQMLLSRQIKQSKSL